MLRTGEARQGGQAQHLPDEQLDMSPEQWVEAPVLQDGNLLRVAMVGLGLLLVIARLLRLHLRSQSKEGREGTGGEQKNTKEERGRRKKSLSVWGPKTCLH